MDLFGLTFVKSLMKKMYCLVVTDDFSRFSWVFFLDTKDETSEILKTFIIGIENLIDLRVKVIRFDNETEFKNRAMNQFYEIKGIKREFSVARTPQQNEVAERKNRTLIDAVKTMLADSKLPTTFWAKVVNTACYFQNRVLVIKPHNKTPYELFLGRTLALSFMRPFRCPVAILNTIDHLGNQSNGSAGTKACDNVGLSWCWLQTIRGEGKKDTEDPGNKDSEALITEEPRVNQEKDGLNSTNRVNAISSIVNAASNEVNAVGRKSSIKLSDDLNMPELEDINIFKDSNKDVFGVDADLNNLESTFQAQNGFLRTNWIKKGIMIRNKARLVAQGHTQEEGINYDEVFAPVTRIKAIRLFLAYASFKDFVVYQMDVKSDFLYGKIEEEMSSMGELTFFLGLRVKQKEDGIFISQDKYVNEILNKFSYSDVKTASTPIETHKTLLKDEKGEDVDKHLYRSMIESLMYLTSSRPNIMFAAFYTLCIEQFWTTATVKNINGEVQLHAKVDGKKVVISKASIRRDLSTIASAVICLATNQRFNFFKYIFDSMVKHLDSGNKFLMYLRFVQVFLDKQVDGMSKHNAIYVTHSHTKKVFSNIRRVGKNFSRRDTPLFPTMLVQAQTDMSEGLTMPLAPQHTPPIIQPPTSKPQKKQKPRKPRRQDTELPQTSVPTETIADEDVNEEMYDSLERATNTATSLHAEQDRGNINKIQSKATPTEPISLRTSSGGSPRRQDIIGDTSAQTMSENVSKQVLNLETTKTDQAIEIANLKKRVKRLERKRKLRTHGLKILYKLGLSARVESSNDESLGSRSINDEEMFDTYVLHDDEVVVKDVNAASIATAITAATTTVVSIDDITLAQALIEIKTS
nr:putative ribonuclease H-like domain-containing protein [Tanacetum cinerariifolium]